MTANAANVPRILNNVAKIRLYRKNTTYIACRWMQQASNSAKFKRGHLKFRNWDSTSASSSTFCAWQFIYSLHVRLVFL